MKSKFLGFSAKLALAILAVGTVFTSCYDSENGDVTKPYVPAPAKYVVSGYVTDFETGQPIVGATISGAVTATTVATGAYTVVGTAPVKGLVKISAVGYVSVERDLNMETIQTGMASYTVSAALVKEDMLPGITVKTLGTTNAAIEFEASTTPAVDLVNNTAEAIWEKLTFSNLYAGGEFVKSATSTRAETEGDKAKAAFAAYIENQFGIKLSAGILNNLTKTFDFEIAPFSSVRSVTMKTSSIEEEYTFTFTDGKVYTFTIKRILGHLCLPKVVSNNIYHGHGHGHGHGGSLNAGGGIFE